MQVGTKVVLTKKIKDYLLSKEAIDAFFLPDGTNPTEEWYDNEIPALLLDRMCPGHLEGVVTGHGVKCIRVKMKLGKFKWECYFAKSDLKIIKD